MGLGGSMQTMHFIFKCLRRNISVNSPHPMDASAMTANYFVKAFCHSDGDAFQAFPCISGHIARHFMLINGS